jgi:predicted nucleic acid-binding Zn ribbon protein
MMKLIDTVCASCGHEDEAWVDTPPKFGEKVVDTRCAKCDSESVCRKPNNQALSFKGSGWYVNDYKGKQQ